MPWLDWIPFRLAPPPMWTDDEVVLPSSSSSCWPADASNIATRPSHWPIIAPTIRAERKEASLAIPVADGTGRFYWPSATAGRIGFCLPWFDSPGREERRRHWLRAPCSHLCLRASIQLLFWALRGASKELAARPAGDGGGGHLAVAQGGVPLPPGVPRLRLRPEEGPPQGNAVQGVPLCLDGFSHGRYTLLFLTPPSFPAPPPVGWLFSWARNFG